VSTTDEAIAPGAAFRTGTLTLRLGRETVGADGATTGFVPAGAGIAIAVDDGDATLAGIAAKINAAGAGVTAKIVADGAGERLSISGPMGGDQAFEITGADAGGAGRSLTELDVGRTAAATTTGTRARDAVVLLDGVQFTRRANAITDLIPGVKLDLVAPTTSPASITASKPTGAITSAVNDFVGAYNEMFALVKDADDPFDGTLRSDTAVDTLKRNLQRLTTAPLATSTVAGAPTTLADIGVSTARDGTLSVNAGRLSKAIADFPAEVEALFAEATGLPAALGEVARQVTSRTSGLDASTAAYKRRQADLADAQAKAADLETGLRDRLTRQFATMDARTSAYKSTMAFMDNQIKAWNRSDD
ncbi:MAG TPA: flagellar filament capping protein FliD, partial [Sphingomonas sp.]|jgi:flagellar hook-associated protein 2